MRVRVKKRVRVWVSVSMIVSVSVSVRVSEGGRCKWVCAVCTGLGAKGKQEGDRGQARVSRRAGEGRGDAVECRQ